MDSPPATPRVHVVDDDPDVVRATALVLDAAGIAVTEWTSPLEFLRSAAIAEEDCILLDVRMPDRTGPEVQEELRQRGVGAPVVFLTAHGDVPTSVRAIKGGAEDFLLKPVDPALLLDAVRRALAGAGAHARTAARLRELRRRHEALTPRERVALVELIIGSPNKQVAAVLGISENTVKVHRLRIMAKMEAESFADLVRMGEDLGLGPERP